MNIKIIKDIYNKSTEIRTIVYEYKTDFNQLVIKSVDIYIELNNDELENHLIDLIPTYHIK